MRNERWRRIRRWNLFTLAALIAVASGCQPRPWVVFASSDASVDVIVRVEYDGHRRDSLVGPGVERFVIVLPSPPATARVLLLDPTSCEVLAVDDLPAESAVAGFHDDRITGRFTLAADAKSVGTGPVLPEDHRCGSR